MRSLDVEEGQGCPQPLLLANSEQGVWAVLLSPKHHVCGLLAEAGNGIEIPLGGEKRSCLWQDVEVVFLVHSNLLLEV